MEQVAVSTSSETIDQDASVNSSVPSTAEDDDQFDDQEVEHVNGDLDESLISEEATKDSTSGGDDASKPKRRRFTKGVIEENQGVFPAEHLREYRWPPDRHGEFFILQEQVSAYLGVLSFKRKYPGRRNKLLKYLRILHILNIL